MSWSNKVNRIDLKYRSLLRNLSVNSPPPSSGSVITMSEVNQPLAINNNHALSANILAMFIVDDANNVVKELVSNTTQAITTAATVVDGLSTFNETVTFNGLFTKASFDNTSIIAYGELKTAYSSETITSLTSDSNGAYVRLKTDAHWDVGGFSKIENAFLNLGTDTTSSHSGITSLSATISADTVTLLNDAVSVNSANNNLQNLGGNDALSVGLGGSLSNLSLVVILNVALAENQLQVIHQDILNLLSNTGNGLSIPEGAEGTGGGNTPESTITLTSAPADGIYRTSARKTAIAASHANSTAFYDDLESRLLSKGHVYGDYTTWYIKDLINRATALMDAYHINNDSDYLNQAKDAFYYRYVTTKWENTNDTYTGRNDFRAEGKSALVLGTQLANHFTAQENANIQAEFLKWANYWLGYMNYDNNFEGVSWQDTDETTSLCEAFLVFALSLEDEVAAAKCLATFEHLYTEVNDYLIDGVCGGGFWCEGTAYNSNTLKNYLRMRILADEHTDLPSQQTFVNLVWDTYIHQYFNLDSPNIWWHGDIEGDNPLDCDQEEARYISFYDTIVELLKGSYREAECVYFRSLLDDSSLNYTGSARLTFQDSRTTGVKPVSPPLYKKSDKGMRMQVLRDSWSADNTVAIMANHAFYVDHNHRNPLGFDLYHKGKAVTKQMTAYALTPPFNGCYLEGHNSNTQATQAYLYGEAKQYNTFSNATYGYTCGDTRDTFNQTGWDKHVFCSQFSRAVFIDYVNQVVLTYDHIVTDPNINEDMDSEPATPWARKVERHHRFLTKATPPTLSNGIYSDTYNGITQHYEPLLPVDSIEIVEEITHADYSSRTADIFPPNQSAHQVREHIQSSDAELMSLLTYGDGVVIAATHSDVTVNAGNVIGVVVNDDTAVLFNKTPEAPLNGVIDFTVSNGAAITSIYVLGVDDSLSYSKSVSGNVITLTSGSGTQVNNEAVLVI